MSMVDGGHEHELVKIINHEAFARAADGHETLGQILDTVLLEHEADDVDGGERKQPHIWGVIQTIACSTDAMFGLRRCRAQAKNPKLNRKTQTTPLIART